MKDDFSSPEAIRSTLQRHGYEYDTIDALRTSGVRYKQAVPLLVSALGQVRDVNTQEAIVRALSVPWAGPLAIPALLELFRRSDSSSDLRWAIGNAIDVVWDDRFFDQFVQLAKDTRYGTARQMIVHGMRSSRRPEAGEILVGLLDDPDVSGHAVIALRRLKYAPARLALETKLNDPRAWVRRAAKGALAALDAAGARP